ncbi:unnamed protein product [Musa acuminata subsp. malaccensis]|uniref:(wild Malaysian banana) hypothetical protein n=1 Tax=Musa acuminata subsp. malaccensis TaxID=214687 RepID=A0A804KJA9_MUSAM|nr:PREDICTED: ethylene-responsive transcription factor ERF017-like [Musa acuminata subsp. malaccensis]CAG1835110.1 unnamed protein product [Musa acuminata subsp. malaccensis]
MTEREGGVPAAGERRYKGVRLRKWGRWVSEIRLPNSRKRIWLGSYDSPEKAARAFDAATACLRGRLARLNFPETPPPRTAQRLTHLQIQAAAARHAASASTPPQLWHPRAASSPSEDASDGFTAGSEDTLDWSFMDSQEAAAALAGAGEFPDLMDDFMCDFFSPVQMTAPLAEVVEDQCPIDLGSNSFLWSF